jgi:rhodanese-related sulfurtransferase
MTNHVSTAQLRQMLETAPGALALLDVRDTAEYNLAHIPGSCSLPRRQIEYRVAGLVPWPGTRVILCDDDGLRAGPAAGTLASMGYTDVSVLQGGLNRWVTDGGGTEWGVNVPSKDFGEKVLLQQHVPEVDPDTLHQWQGQGQRIVLLDSRTPEEHNRSCIPGSRSMPGAELGLRVWDLVDSPDTTVVVHCAGRTRSIIGAASLRRLGVPNVYALKNGTMGWLLAGLELETGSQRLDLPEPTADGRATAAAKARDLALREGVRFVDVSGAQAILARAQDENVYAIDVRTRDDYAAGHVPGFRWAPGGQVVQATDNYIAVRDGTILLACDGSSVRAAMTGAWLRQLGHTNVFVLEGGVEAWRAAGQFLGTGYIEPPPLLYDAARRRVATVPATEAAASARTVLFVGTSEEFAAGHLPGSTWLPRGFLELQIAETVTSPDAPLLVTCRTGVDSVLAAATLIDLGYRDVAALDGGTDGARKAGTALETGLTGVTRAPNDVLPATRSYAEMLNYLRWEEDLGRRYEH